MGCPLWMLTLPTLRPPPRRCAESRLRTLLRTGCTAREILSKDTFSKP